MPDIHIGSILKFEDSDVYGIGRVIDIMTDQNETYYWVDCGDDGYDEYPVYREEIRDVWNIGTLDKE